MDPDSPTFLNFGAFETTAFFTALLVALYSFIRNPTGRQGAQDRSEYRVYSGWRCAMCILLAQLIFGSVVLGFLIRDRKSPKAVAWVMCLMAAPWAPLSGSLQRTVSSFRRVQSMMRARTTRNQVAAVAREYLLCGQRGVSLSRIVYWASNKLPVTPLRALSDVPELNAHQDVIRRCATPAAPVSNAGRGCLELKRKRAWDGPMLLEMGVLWTVHQGAQPWDLRGRWVDAVFSALDPFMYLWTEELKPLAVTPFPDVGHGGATGGAARALPVRLQARYLDMVDELQDGGTMSDELYERAVRGRYCDRCGVAIRGAVEAFMESNARGHTDTRAGEWLLNVDTKWSGHYEAVVDVLWEAAFMESSCTRLTVSTKVDYSNMFGDRSKVLTLRFLSVLFLMLRAVMQEAPVLEQVSHHVASRLHTWEYWKDFWSQLKDRVSVNGVVEAAKINTVAFKDVTRAMQDKEVTAVVDLLQRHPITGTLCGVPSCWLHTATEVTFTRVTQPPSTAAAGAAAAPIPAAAGTP